MIFEYNSEEVFTKQLDVEDPGNVCIRCTNENLVDFYLITKTVMGKTYILKYGPVMPDLGELMDNFSVMYRKIDYKENTIKKEISFFINDTKKKINEVEEITAGELFGAFPNIEDIFNSIEELGEI